MWGGKDDEYTLTAWVVHNVWKKNWVPKVDLHQNKHWVWSTFTGTGFANLPAVLILNSYLTVRFILIGHSPSYPLNCHEETSTLFCFSNSFLELFVWKQWNIIWTNRTNMINHVFSDLEAVLRVTKPLKRKTDNTGQFLPSPTAKGLGFTQLDPWIGSVIIYVQTHLVRSIHIIHIHLTVHIADIPISP